MNKLINGMASWVLKLPVI